jgi:sporulation protein YlmC with PRC-barrel domain
MNCLVWAGGREMQHLECKIPELKGVHVTRNYNPDDVINPQRVASTTIIGDKLKNTAGKEIGKIEDIVFDLTCGCVSYLVVSSGGFAGIGDKFLAIPLEALTLDAKLKVFTIDLNLKNLKNVSGFDKNHWPLRAEWPLESH